MAAGTKTSRKRWYIGIGMVLLVGAVAAGLTTLKGASSEIDASKVAMAEQGTMVRLDLLELCSVRLNHVNDSLAAGERFRRASNGPRLHKYRDQVRAVLLGEYAGELEDACSLGPPIDEDHDFRELSNALVSPQG